MPSPFRDFEEAVDGWGRTSGVRSWGKGGNTKRKASFRCTEASQPCLNLLCSVCRCGQTLVWETTSVRSPTRCQVPCQPPRIILPILASTARGERHRLGLGFATRLYNQTVLPVRGGNYMGQLAEHPLPRLLSIQRTEVGRMWFMLGNTLAARAPLELGVPSLVQWLRLHERTSPRLSRLRTARSTHRARTPSRWQNFSGMPCLELHCGAGRRSG